MSVPLAARDVVPAIIIEISKLPHGKSNWKWFLSKQTLSKYTAAENLPWNKLLLRRYICTAFLFDAWRISPKSYGPRNHTLNKNAYKHIETWRTCPLSGDYPYIYVDGVCLKRSWGGKIRNVSVLVAIGISQDGCQKILGTVEGMKEDHERWRSFFVWLKECGLTGVRLIIGNKNLGMLEPIPEVFPAARYQCCTVHFTEIYFLLHPVTKWKW